MDLLLGPFADAFLGGMPENELARYEQLLQEDDQALYEWMTGRVAPPSDLAPLVTRIAQYASEKFAQQSRAL